jgi:hypothetical protein
MNPETIALWETIFTTISWFSMVAFVSIGISLIVLQFLLPMAWNQIRANPPTGTGWAHSLWYGRDKVYGAVLGVCVLLGIIAAGLYLAGILV